MRGSKPSERSRLVEVDVDVEIEDYERPEFVGRRYCNGDVLLRIKGVNIRFTFLFILFVHAALITATVFTWIPELFVDIGVRWLLISPISLVWIVYASVFIFILSLFGIFQFYDYVFTGSGLAKKVIPESRRVVLRRLGCFPGDPRSLKDSSQTIPYILVSILLFLEFFIIFGNIFLLSNAMIRVEHGEIERIFGPSDPPNPFPTPFALGPYLIPGPFQIYGPYGEDNTDLPHDSYTYKEGCKPECVIHVYMPPGNLTNVPVLYHIHGGSYISGHPGMSATAFGYWLERGYGITSIGYPFLNKGINTTIFDIFNASMESYKYFKANAASWGMDPTRVLMFGESAGGGLAVMTAYMVNDTNIRGVYNQYGFEELEYYWENTRGGYPDQFVLMGLRGDLSKENLQRASASHFINDFTPPTISIHGTWDGMVPFSQSSHLHEKLTEKGIKNMLIPAPSYGHILDFCWYSAGGQLSKYIFERFAAAVLLNN